MARLLQHELRDRPIVGPVVGKTAMRDVLVDCVGCSLLQAERLIDQLERSGYVELITGDPARPLPRRLARWRIRTEPAWLG